MTHWNYRVVRRISYEDCYYYGIVEVYYDDDENIEAWTEGWTKPSGETFLELKEDMNHFLAALEKPVLVEKIVDGKEKLVEIDHERNSFDSWI